MKLYGGRLINNRVSQQITSSREMRDGVVIDVYPDDKYCRVKIQGSATHLKAWFPANWQTVPNYLKPGNAVRIVQQGGNKSRIEIAGHGISLPTDVNGDPVIPTPSTLVDAVLTSCNIIATNPATMAATILNGTYRINETIYALSGLMMDDATVEMDRSDLEIDAIGGSVSFDAAHASLYRYDYIVAGTDGVAHVVKGTNFATTVPAAPAVPSDHVLLGSVLIPPHTTSITGGHIGAPYTAPIASGLTVTLADESMPYSQATTTLSIAVNDQYGNFYANPEGGGWLIGIFWMWGNGTLSYADMSAISDAALYFRHTGNSAAIVTYTRNQDSTDASPLLRIIVDGQSRQAVSFIELLSVGGEPML